MEIEKRIDALEGQVRKHVSLQKFIWIAMLLINFTIITLFIRLNALINILVAELLDDKSA